MGSCLLLGSTATFLAGGFTESNVNKQQQVWLATPVETCSWALFRHGRASLWELLAWPHTATFLEGPESDALRNLKKNLKKWAASLPVPAMVLVGCRCRLPAGAGPVAGAGRRVPAGDGRLCGGRPSANKKCIL